MIWEPPCVFLPQGLQMLGGGLSEYLLCSELYQKLSFKSICISDIRLLCISSQSWESALWCIQADVTEGRLSVLLTFPWYRDTCGKCMWLPEREMDMPESDLGAPKKPVCWDRFHYLKIFTVPPWQNTVVLQPLKSDLAL